MDAELTDEEIDRIQARLDAARAEGCNWGARCLRDELAEDVATLLAEVRRLRMEAHHGR